MIELKFRGDKELVKLVIDREKKKLWVTSSRTGYKEVETKWQTLFDKGKERIQDRITEKLDDEKFIIVITMSMNRLGYIRII